MIEQEYIPPNKTFLCIEDGEEFTIEAPNLAQAREDCSMWNAEVVRELRPNEVIDPNQADMEVYYEYGKGGSVVDFKPFTTLTRKTKKEALKSLKLMEEDGNYRNLKVIKVPRYDEYNPGGYRVSGERKFGKGGKLNTDKIIKATDEILDADITNLDLGPKGISKKLAEKGIVKKSQINETANFLSKEMKKQGFYAKGGELFDKMYKAHSPSSPDDDTEEDFEIREKMERYLEKNDNKKDFAWERMYADHKPSDESTEEEIEFFEKMYDISENYAKGGKVSKVQWKEMDLDEFYTFLDNTYRRYVDYMIERKHWKNEKGDYTNVLDKVIKTHYDLADYIEEDTKKAEEKGVDYSPINTEFIKKGENKKGEEIYDIEVIFPERDNEYRFIKVKDVVGEDDTYEYLRDFFTGWDAVYDGYEEEEEDYAKGGKVSTLKTEYIKFLKDNGVDIDKLKFRHIKSGPYGDDEVWTHYKRGGGGFVITRDTFEEIKKDDPQDFVYGYHLPTTYAKGGKMMSEEDNPCWEGYEMYGMKKKGGKEVPNCVPKKKKLAKGGEIYEDAEYISVLEGRLNKHLKLKKSAEGAEFLVEDIASEVGDFNTKHKQSYPDFQKKQKEVVGYLVVPKGEDLPNEPFAQNIKSKKDILEIAEQEWCYDPESDKVDKELMEDYVECIRESEDMFDGVGVNVVAITRAEKRKNKLEWQKQKKLKFAKGGMTFDDEVYCDSCDKPIDLEYEDTDTYGRCESCQENYPMEEYAKGGALDKEFKFDSNFVVYVPSTSDVSAKISREELYDRVDDVKDFVSDHFGGYTETDAEGGYKSESGDVVEEDVVKVSVFTKEKDWKDRENLIVAQVKEWANEWGQEAIGFEHEDANGKRKLYYIDRNGKKGFGGFIFGVVLGGYVGYKYGLTKDKRRVGDLFTTEQKYYDRAKSEYQDYQRRKRRGGPDIQDVYYEEFAEGGLVSKKLSKKELDIITGALYDIMFKQEPDKDFNIFIGGSKIKYDSVGKLYDKINYRGLSFNAKKFAEGGEVFAPSTHMYGKEVELVHIYDENESSEWQDNAQYMLDTHKKRGDVAGVVHRGHLHGLYVEKGKYKKGGELPLDVKVYSNDKGIYTVVDAGSVFEMTNDFKGKYVGELKDFPSDITHWGKLIDIKETPSQMQIGISHLNKI